MALDLWPLLVVNDGHVMTYYTYSPRHTLAVAYWFHCCSQRWRLASAIRCIYRRFCALRLSEDQSRLLPFSGYVPLVRGRRRNIYDASMNGSLRVAC